MRQSDQSTSGIGSSHCSSGCERRGESLIELRDIHFGFQEGRSLFSGLTITFPFGKTTAILGPSGSGKSTIVRLICGLIEPDAGSVLVDGSNVSGAGHVRGVLFQEDTLVPWLPAVDNAMFPRQAKRSPSVRVQATEQLIALGLGDALTKLPHELSAGMKKRLEFVRAVIADEEFLVADEPFTELDFHQKRLLWRQWRTLMQSGNRTGIIVTHDPAEAIAIADRIVVISATMPSTIVLDVTIESEADSATLESAIVEALLGSPNFSGDHGDHAR